MNNLHHAKDTQEAQEHLNMLLTGKAKGYSNKHHSHRTAPVSRAKAEKILEDGTIGGKTITPKQRGMFASIASGKYGHEKK